MGLRGWPKGKLRGPRKPKDVPLVPEAQALVDAVVVPEAPPEPKRTFSKPDDKWGRQGMKHGNWSGAAEYNPAEENVDVLAVPDIPEGYDAKWVTTSILGKEEPGYLAAAQANHWAVVHSGDFDGRYDGRYDTKRGVDSPVTKDNNVLVMRPMEYSIKSREDEMRKAQEMANLKQGALMSGQIPGVTGASHRSAVATNKIGKSYERVAVPDDK